MIVVHQEIIEEIAADLFGRVHAPYDVKIRPVRERRHDMGQHSRLDLRG